MHLTFTSPGHPTVTYSKSLASQVDANGKFDPLDNRFSYGGDSLYYKAGLYNQCSTNKKGGTYQNYLLTQPFPRVVVNLV